MPSVRLALAVLLAVPALLAGCSATPAPTTPESSSPPAITANPTPVSTEATTATTAGGSPAATTCPSGDYQATGFTAAGADSTTGTGALRDVDVSFRGGRYVFEFDEDDPITLTINGRRGRVRIDGDVRGSYTGTADDLTFTLGDTTGTARITQGGTTRTVSMKQVATVLAPQGKGSAVCTGNEVTLRTGSVTWELVRDDD